MDIYFTLNAIFMDPEPRTTDGMDLKPLLINPAAKLSRKALFFHYPHYYETTTPAGAIRSDGWKLLEYFEDNHVELYNLSDDLAEQHDLSRQMPEKSAGLLRQLHDWRAAIGANMPTTNPDFKSRK